MIGFAKWQPDRFALNANVAGEALGVLPGPDGYVPWLSPVSLSAALPAACVGAYAARTAAGSIVVYAGTQAKLDKYASATSWTDVTRVSGGDYGVAADDTWSMDQYGSRLISVNVNDDVQYIDVDSGSAFDALAGSPPKASVVRTVGDFIMLGGLADNPNAVLWCGRNNSEFWTPGTQDCDQQVFPDGGPVRGIAPFGNGQGTILQDGAVRAYEATNDRTIFTFAKIENRRGLIAKASLVVTGGLALYLSSDGFYATDGSGPSKPIGTDIVNAWFQATVNQNRIGTVRGAVDPVRQRVFWIFPSGTGMIFDQCLCYDIALDAWSHAAINASFILAAATAGYTVDNIDALLTALGYTLDTTPFSFDAAFLTGGSPFTAILDQNFELSFFSGSPMAAVMETADVQLLPGFRAFVRGVRPVTDSPDASCAAGTKERPQTAPSFGALSAQNAQGLCPMRASGRFHRFRMSIPAGSTWTHATGVSLDDEGSGQGLVTSAGTR